MKISEIRKRGKEKKLSTNDAINLIISRRVVSLACGMTTILGFQFKDGFRNKITTLIIEFVAAAKIKNLPGEQVQLIEILTERDGAIP